ncbi:MAG TPA: LytTR family DNA-binding domain-containing protein [Sphaerochaeta sp.]|nr:LytTR family DNA-binding domain-containing protein [Sphaerochaeta sp.]
MEEMIKIAMCDDDREELARTRRNCMSYAANHPNCDLMIKTFEDASSVLSHIELHGSFDILILDIYMPGITGVELAESLRKNHDVSEIIFLTSSPNHAIEAFSLNATHYILKPYTTAQFDAALDKAVSQLAKRKQATITLKSSLGIHKVLFADIMYVETEKHMQNIHLSDGLVLNIRMTSIELFDKLSHDTRFYKYGSSYILNLGKVREITASCISLDGDKQLHMQRRQFKPLIDRYTQYSLKGV